MSSENDTDFEKRREDTIQQINALDKDTIENNPQRDVFFEAVYENAEGDAALVPWADLKAKQQLDDWLDSNPSKTGKAIDVGCGLGDNAERLAKAGYETTAFDFSKKAIEWATSRFSNSPVAYHHADLFNLPDAWRGSFDLVHECYTLQAIPPATLAQSVPAVASLVAPGGTLLVYTRTRENGTDVEGPPWPLEEKVAMSFDQHGFQLITAEEFTVERPGRLVPGIWCEWRKL